MLQLNFRESKPIYEQVKDAIRRLVVTNALEPGEQLPSIREMAGKFAINPNTISRAYRELESEGYLFSVTGKGTYVAENSFVIDKRSEELKSKFDEVVSELIYLNTPPEELKSRIDSIERADV